MSRYLTFINDVTFISGAHKYTYWYLKQQIQLWHEAYIISYHQAYSNTITYTQEMHEGGIHLISIYKNIRPTDTIHILCEDEQNVLIEIFSKIGLFDFIELSTWDSPLHLGIAEICRKNTKILTLTEHTYYLICYKRWLFDDDNKICEVSEIPDKCSSCSVYKGRERNLPNIRHQNTKNILEKYIDTIHTPSQSLQEDIQKSFPSIWHKVRKIDIEASVEVQTEVKKSDTFTYKFGFIWRLHKYKWIKEIDNVFAKIWSLNFKVLYAISTVDDSHNFTSVWNYTYEVLENISYDNVWRDFYSQVEYVIFPSIWKENYPLVCIECKKFNKKVIAHNVWGVPEIFENYPDALLYNSEEELFSIINTIVHNDEN